MYWTRFSCETAIFFSRSSRISGSRGGVNFLNSFRSGSVRFGSVPFRSGSVPSRFRSGSGPVFCRVTGTSHFLNCKSETPVRAVVCTGGVGFDH